MITRITMTALLTILISTAADAATYIQNFDGFANGTTVLGDGSTMAGNASVQGGQLRLTLDGATGQNSSFVTPALADSSVQWTAVFDVTFIDGPDGNPAADGMSFSYGNITPGTLAAVAEEGWAGAANHISYEIDTWMNFDAEQGLNIAENGTDLAGAFTNGPILNNDTSVSGTVTASYSPINGVSFVTTGLLTNANFFNIPVTGGFTGLDSYVFALAARTGGATETVLIDNLVISTIPEPSTFVLAALGLLVLVGSRRTRRCR